jgi:tryptophan 7-halogenase
MAIANINSVVIVGGGVAGWMSAACLATMLGGKVAITLLDCDLGPVTCARVATIPPIKAFHAMLGIDEAELVAKTQGTMKLGTHFVNWGALGNRYFHPHGSYGAEFDAVPLHQWWLKSRGEAATTPSLDDLSMAWAMARDSRFAPPAQDRRLIQSTFDYAYHMDDVLYADYMASLAKSRGVLCVAGEIADVKGHPMTGFVDELQLSDGQKLSADLYIDCSGAKGLLIGQALRAEFEDWSHYLPCNKAVSVMSERGGDFTPYTRITQREAGWQWRTPLQHHTSAGYVYAADYCTDDEALGTLLDNLDGRTLGEPMVTHFTNGRRNGAFHKNVVAFGDAAGFLEPLEATSHHMVQSGLTRLLALWPKQDCDPLLAQEYNQLTAKEWDMARDFLVLHNHATSRTDTPLWRYCKDMAIPEGLANRMAHWRASGRLISPRPELFQSASWLSVYVGQGYEATAHDPLADARENRVDYQGRLAGIARLIEETSAQMPLHRDWIDKNCRGART